MLEQSSRPPGASVNVSMTSPRPTTASDVRRWIDRPVRCTSVQEQGGDSRRRRRTGSHPGQDGSLWLSRRMGAAPVSHTTGARTPRTQPLISSVAIRSTPGWPVSGAGPGCGPTLASNDAARPTLGLPLLVALRAQVTTGHSVGRGHSPLMLWAARASVACSCSRSGTSPPLLDNAFRRDLLWRFCR